jgi:predicted dehydrogenase
MILGEPLSSVSALLQGRVFDYPVDDGAALVARSESGALLSQSVAYNCPDTFPRRRLEVIGTDGRALAINTMGQDAGGQLTLMHSDGSEAPVEFDKEQSPFLRQVETFAQSVRADEPFPFSPEHDLHTMRLVDAAVESSGTKVSPASPPAA